MRIVIRTSISIACLSCLIGCGRSEPPAFTQSPLTVIVSADTSGWIVPCGCTSNQSGGLLRRGAIVEAMRKQADVVYLDAGGATSGVSEYDRLKFDAILRGELAMGIVAHNVGTGEARLGVKTLQELRTTEHGRAFVSCNTRDESGELVVLPYHIAERSGCRLLITGILSDSESIEGITIEPPAKSILELLKSVEAYDALIVLAYASEEELRHLAESLPEADLIVGGPTGQSLKPTHYGPVLVASVTNKGKFLAIFHSEPEPQPGVVRRWRSEIVEVDDAWPDAPTQQENLDRFYEHLADVDVTADQTSLVSQVHLQNRQRIVGSDACQACHEDDCDTWTASTHASAWQSLQETGAHVDSYCQQCHATGFGLLGGFVSVKRSPHRVNVGCESCHGGSQEHVDEPSQPTTFAHNAAQQCRVCHDRENSPNFAFDRYWRQISHGTAGG